MNTLIWWTGAVVIFAGGVFFALAGLVVLMFWAFDKCAKGTQFFRLLWRFALHWKDFDEWRRAGKAKRYEPEWLRDKTTRETAKGGGQ